MLKKIILFMIIISMLCMMVACSDGDKQKNTDLTYEEQVEQFGNKLANLMNNGEYEKVCEYWSEAYVSCGEIAYGKSYSELKSQYKANCINNNLHNCKVESVEAYETDDGDKIYAMMISYYVYNQNNDKKYMSDLLYVFKEGEEFVYAAKEKIIPIEKIIELSKEKYQFSSLISE